MFEILNNPWVIGIIGGIISGLVVFFVTNLILARKNRKKQIEHIHNANQHLLNTLRPFVIETETFSSEIANAIIASTARIYRVEVDKLYTEKMIYEDLICEIAGNSYVSTEKKSDITTKIANHMKAIDSPGDRDFRKTMDSFDIEFQRIDRMQINRLLSILMALLTMGVTMVGILYSLIGDEYSKVDTSTFTLVILVVSILSVVLAFGVVVIGYIRKNRDKQDKDSK